MFSAQYSLQIAVLFVLITFPAIYSVDVADVDVAIVGSGLSGLTAGYRLKSALPDLKLVILEAGKRHGGRAFSPEFKVGANKTDRFNLGGEWIGEKQRDIQDILKELEIGTYATDVTGKVLIETLGKTENSTNYYVIDERAYQELLKRGKELDDEIARIDLSKIGKKELQKLEDMSLDDWMSEKGWPEFAKSAMNDFTEEDIDVSAEDVSFAFFLNYFQTQEITDSLYKDFKTPFQGFRINNGSQYLADKLLDKIGKKNIRFDSPVISIDWANPKQIELKTPKTVLTAQRVILAIPPIAAKNIKFNPNLPSEKQRTLDSYKPYIWEWEYSVKAVFTYATKFWRDQGLSGYISADSDPTPENELPAMFVADATSASGNPALVVFADLETNNTEEYQDLISAHLRQILGDPADDFIDYKQIIWQTDPFYKGCVATIPPGKFRYTEYMQNIRKQTGGLHWAGTETAEKSSLLLSGAVNAGNRVAKEVLAKLPKAAKTARPQKDDPSAGGTRIRALSCSVPLLCFLMLLILF